MNPRGVWREGGTARARDAHTLLELGRVQRAQVPLAEPELAGAIHALAQAHRLSAVQSHAQLPALDEVRIDAVPLEHSPHLIHGGEHCPLERQEAVAPATPFVQARRAREEPRDPTAVATRRAKTRHLALQHHDPQRGLGKLEVVGRPQAGVARTDDRHVGLRGAAKRRTPGRRTTERTPPVAQFAAPHRRSVACLSRLISLAFGVERGRCGSAELGRRPRLENAVEVVVDLLVVEGDQPRDLLALGQRGGI